MNRFFKLATGVSVSAVILLGAALPSGAQTRPSPTPERDWGVPSGHFYTQAGSGAGGFAIGDDDGMPFWASFQQLGGVGALGYPATRRFVLGGFVYQATQAALLQLQPDTGAVVLGNTFELLQEAGRDAWLHDQKGIPYPTLDDGSSSYEDAVHTRLGWLSEGAIKERYLRNPNPAARTTWTERDSIDLYGLPMSRPERFGPFIAQRFQRVAFQLWVESAPGMPAPGTVTAVLGGDLLKEAGLIAGPAATPHGAGALVNRPVSLGGSSAPTAMAPAAPTATPRVGGTPTPRPGVVSAAPTLVIDGTLSEYSIYLPRLSAKPGTARFTLTNSGIARHNLRIVGGGVDQKSPDLLPGRSGHVDVTFGDPGPYYLYCDIADHEQLGMALTFNIDG